MPDRVPREIRSKIMSSVPTKHTTTEKSVRALLTREGYRYRLHAAGLPGTENRDADFYQYQWYHKNLDYECRWRITKSMEVAQATQIKEDNRWSLLDVVAYSILMLRMSAKWWESLHYFGGGVLCAILSVGNLELARGTSREFIKLFGPGSGDFGMRPEVLEVGQQQLVVAQVGVPINFAEMHSEIPETVTSIMNSLLRTLGHGVFWAEFSENVRVIANGMH